MAEAGKENVFLREKCEKCFVEIIDAMISTRKVLKNPENSAGLSEHKLCFMETFMKNFQK